MIKFYENRKIFFTISLLIFVVGIVGLFMNGVKLSIQFQGGAIIKYSYVGDINTQKIADVTTKVLSGRTTDVQTTTDLATKSKKVVLNLSGTEGLSAQDQQKLETALFAEFKDNQLKLSETSIVQPFMGKRFLTRGIWALLLASFLIVIYVWIRFKRISGLSAGVMGLLALLHDILVVFFVFVLFKIPLNDSFIAVCLTIIGYSINDTIIIYDRIRENTILSKKISKVELVNKSITQTLTRSLNTVLTVFVSILIVYIFASMYNIESIKTFALPMLAGVATGCYSSICIASPLWVMWQKHKEKEAKAARA